MWRGRKRGVGGVGREDVELEGNGEEREREWRSRGKSKCYFK